MRVILPATTIPTAHPRCSLWLKIPLVVLGSSSRYGSKFPSLWLKNPPVVGTWPKAGAAFHVPPRSGRVALGLLRPCFARLLASLVGQPDACGAGESLRYRNCRTEGSQLVATALDAAILAAHGKVSTLQCDPLAGFPPTESGISSLKSRLLWALGRGILFAFIDGLASEQI